MRYLLAGLLLLVCLPGAWGQYGISGFAPEAPDAEGGAAEPPSSIVPVKAGLELPALLRGPLFDVTQPVTRGDPAVEPSLWQRTWGVAGFNAYPVGNKMAPNGVPYDPLFSLDLLLNIALTRERDLYLFARTKFWTQKSGEGITNGSQGSLDFSKRQLDLDGGIAWNYTGPLEARAYVYSFNNLNRGTSTAYPSGFNDGFVLENRYYLPNNNFDKGLYRYLGVGYYVTKDLIGADGQTFKPSLFLSGSVAYDFMPDSLYGYAEFQFIAERPLVAKLLLIDAGVACRPFSAAPDLEFRLGADNNIDLQLAYTRSLFYASVRVVW